MKNRSCFRTDTDALNGSSIGMKTPMEFKGKNPYVRTSYVTKAKEKALLECVALGAIEDESLLDSYADLEACLDLCENSAEAGFQELEIIASEANWDKETIEKRISKQLDVLYTQIVERDI